MYIPDHKKIQVKSIYGILYTADVFNFNSHEKNIAFIFYSYNESVEIVNREKNKSLRSTSSLIDCIVKDLATEFNMQIKPKDGELYA